MKRIGFVLLTLAFTQLVPTAFAQFREPIGPYNATDQGTRGVQERGG